MKITKQTALALMLALGATVGAASAASAQSAYTTGTIASDERAGYPAASPYGGGLYAYAPGHGSPSYGSLSYGSANVAVPGYGSDGRPHVLRGRR